MLTVINLHGELGKIVGEKWELFIKSPSEAIRAIEAQTNKFFRYLKEHNDNLEYRIIINGKDHTCADEMLINSDNYETIDIVPVPAGSAGLWQTIIGVVLIVVAVVAIVYTGGIAAAAATPFLGSLSVLSVATNVGLIGLSLTLGGIAQMMAPSPNLGATSLARQFSDDPSKNKDPHLSSYLFSGATNTTKQGNVVPLGYGRLIVGSQLISFGLSKSPLSDEIVSEMQPPGTQSQFLSNPIWDAMAADPIRQPLVRSVKIINHYTHAQTLQAAFALNLIDSTTSSAYSIKHLKRFLHFSCYLFSGSNGVQNHISRKELRDYYELLGHPGDLGNTASWEDIAWQIAIFYTTN